LDWHHAGQTDSRTDICCLDIDRATGAMGPVRRGWFAEVGGFHQNLDDGTRVVVADLALGPSLQYDLLFAHGGRFWFRGEAGGATVVVWRRDVGVDWGWDAVGRVAYVPPIPLVNVHFGLGVLARGYVHLHPDSVPAMILFLGVEL
jgi:hypothetical protein